MLEVVIAVSVLMIILAPAGALFVNSIRNTAMDKNELIGAALAEEGVEMMRNFRDTNFLKFSSKKQDCWNVMPNETECIGATSGIGSPLAPTVTYYKLTLNPANMTWGLESPTPQFDLGNPGTDPNNNIEIYRLKLDVDAADPNSTGVYFVQPSTVVTPLARAASTFYRQISVEYLDVNGDSFTDKAMKVTSLVRYKSGTKFNDIKRILILTNQPL